MLKKNVHIYLITMRKKKKLPREKNEFYVHITMIAEIRLAALLARATLLVLYSLETEQSTLNLASLPLNLKLEVLF